MMKRLVNAAALGLLILATAPAHAAESATVLAPPEWRARWGYLLDVIDVPYVQDPSTGLDVQTVLTWAVPGEALVSKAMKIGTGEVIFTSEIRLNPASGKLWSSAEGASAGNLMAAQPDGTIISVSEGIPGVTIIAVSWMTPDRRVHSETRRNDGTGWMPMDSVTTAPASGINGPVSPARNTQEIENTLALLQARADLKSKEDQLAALRANAAREKEREDDLRRREAAQAAQDAEYAELEGKRVVQAAQAEAESRRSSQELEDSIQRLRDSTAEYEAVAKRLRAPPAPAPKGGRQPSERLSTGERASPRFDRQVGASPRVAAHTPVAPLPAQPAPDTGAASNSNDDANQCVTAATLASDDTTKGNTAAYVTNGCGRPVDLRICLMTESKGWQCAVTYGLAPQGTWSSSAYHATGNVFQDARISGSERGLRRP